MGEMIEQIWVRKTSEALGAEKPVNEFWT